MYRIAIIGSGISGLSAAHFLKTHAQITLFEKSRGSSGRAATRRADPFAFDHGAQYFTVRTKPFQEFIQPLLDNGTIARWNPRYVKMEGPRIVERRHWAEDEPRYVGVPGMNQIGKYLAQGLEIRLERKIVSLQHTGKWELTDHLGQVHPGFDWVISTVPAPQALSLLPPSFLHYRDIEAIKMRACFALMLGFEKPLPMEFEAANITKSNLNWIAMNSHKPNRPEPFTLVAHSTEEYAEAHLYDDHPTVMKQLVAETARILGHGLGSIKHKGLHGWHHANNADRKQNGAIWIDPGQNLAACGDWCFGGRIEGAFTSAYNLANTMLDSGLLTRGRVAQAPASRLVHH